MVDPITLGPKLTHRLGNPILWMLAGNLKERPPYIIIFLLITLLSISIIPNDFRKSQNP